MNANIKQIQILNYVKYDLRGYGRSHFFLKIYFLSKLFLNANIICKHTNKGLGGSNKAFFILILSSTVIYYDLNLLSYGQLLLVLFIFLWNCYF